MTFLNLRKSAAFLFLAWGSFIIMNAGCSDELNETTSPANSFINSNLVIRDTTIVATSTSSFRQFIGMNGRLNLLGRTQGYEARLLLQFYPSTFPQRDTITVESATLTLRAETWSGAPGGLLGFTVHKITGAWGQTTVRWDSLPSYEVAPRGTFSGVISADTHAVVVSLDTSLVKEWLMPRTVTQYGILLLPSLNSDVIRGFHPFDFDSVKFYPTLTVIARNPSGSRDTSTFTFGIDSFVANNDAPVPGTDFILAQAGIVYRSILRFDVSFLPRGSLVHSAEMALVRDPARSRLTKFTSDTVVVAHLRLSDTENEQFESQGSVGRGSESLPDVFSFDARRPVQTWIKGPNNGLILRVSNLSEFSSLDLYAFHNHTAVAPANRPKIRIKYSIDQRENSQ